MGFWKKNYYFSRDLFHQQFHGTIILMAFDLQDLIGRIPFLKTSSLHLKMDAWKTFSFPFGALFSGAKSLSKWVIYRWKVPRYPKNHGISSHWCPNWRSQTQTGGWILDLFFFDCICISILAHVFGCSNIYSRTVGSFSSAFKHEKKQGLAQGEHRWSWKWTKRKPLF